MNNNYSLVKYFCLFVISTGCSLQLLSQNISDNDLKSNVVPITGALQTIVSLEPKRFEYKTVQYKQLQLPVGQRYGFIAEEFQAVLPSLVYQKPLSFMAGKNNYRNATIKTIDVESLLPILIASIKEQQQQIDEMKLEIEALKK